MSKITSVAHAQEVLGTQVDWDSYDKGLNAAGVPTKDIAPQRANYQLWMITEANNKLNGWNNKKHDPDQTKYSVWAPYIVAKKDRPSGFGLAFYRTPTGTRLPVSVLASKLVPEPKRNTSSKISSICLMKPGCSRMASN
jgi:hypothetical protein